MMKNRLTATAAMLMVLLLSSSADARLAVEGPAAFRQQVESALIDGRNMSVYLQQLIAAAKKSTSVITIRPITEDRGTWHYSGVRTRSHTQPLDERRRGAARSVPTDSVIFINVDRITRQHKSYRSGVLIHELVHGLDLAAGRYHGDYVIREKRAVFFQNIWRAHHRKTLRADYHDRFETLEYQQAARTGSLGDFVRYYFQHNDVR